MRRKGSYRGQTAAAGVQQGTVAEEFPLAASSTSQAPKPSPGPHKQRECLPLLLVLRNRLK